MEQKEQKWHVKHKKVYYWISFWAISALIAFSGAIAVTLLVQVTPVVAAASITSVSCQNPTSLTANVSSFLSGMSFVQYIRFTCTADSMAYKESGAIVTTPTFSLPTGVSQLWSYRSTTGTGGTCAVGTTAWQMTSGSPHTFPAGNNLGWDYCIVISASASADITAFTVTWSG